MSLSLLFVRPEHAIRNRRRRRQVAILVLGMDSHGYAMEVLEGLRRWTQGSLFFVFSLSKGATQCTSDRYASGSNLSTV